MIKKGDILLLIFVILISIILFLVINQSKENDLIAVIRHEDRIVKRIDLNNVERDYSLVIKGKYTNTVKVEKGRIKVADSDCPHKICVKTGWLTKKGETAVCIPNRLIIKIKGKIHNVDGITY